MLRGEDTLGTRGGIREKRSHQLHSRLQLPVMLGAAGRSCRHRRVSRNRQESELTLLGGTALQHSPSCPFQPKRNSDSSEESL